MSSTMVKTEPTRTHVLPGAILASFVALIVIAFGGGYLLGQGLHKDPQGLAPDSVVQLVDDGIAAINTGDVAALEAMYTPDAVVTDLIGGTETVGASQIADLYAPSALFLTRTSEVVMRGNYAAYAFEYNVTGEPVAGVAMLQIQDGKVVHQWVTGD